MKAAPDGLYQSVLVFGGKVEATPPPTANIGGVFGTPNYALSYLLAARLTLERAAETGRVDDVALPVAYLQRHAFELGLKSLIDIAYDVADEGERIRLVERREPPDSVTVRYADRSHDLRKLIADLGEALTIVNYGEVPDELVAVADLLAAVEEDVPDRLRYGRVGRRTEHPMASLPESRPFEVGSMQERLEDAFARFLLYRENALDLNADEWNLLEALAVEAEACFQQLLRLGVEP